jgi:hypothetical protein
MNKAVQSNSIWNESEISPRLLDMNPYISSTNINDKFIHKNIDIFLESGFS